MLLSDEDVSALSFGSGVREQLERTQTCAFVETLTKRSWGGGGGASQDPHCPRSNACGLAMVAQASGSHPCVSKVPRVELWHRSGTLRVMRLSPQSLRVSLGAGTGCAGDCIFVVGH